MWSELSAAGVGSCDVRPCGVGKKVKVEKGMWKQQGMKERRKRRINGEVRNKQRGKE